MTTGDKIKLIDQARNRVERGIASIDEQIADLKAKVAEIDEAEADVCLQGFTDKTWAEYKAEVEAL